MTLCEFLGELFEGRSTHVAPPEDVSESELQEAGEFLANFEGLYRLNIPGDPPRLDLAAALESRILRRLQPIVKATGQ
jgi:hypothetical protein